MLWFNWYTIKCEINIYCEIRYCDINMYYYTIYYMVLIPYYNIIIYYKCILLTFIRIQLNSCENVLHVTLWKISNGTRAAGRMLNWVLISATGNSKNGVPPAGPISHTNRFRYNKQIWTLWSYQYRGDFGIQFTKLYCSFLTEGRLVFQYVSTAAIKCIHVEVAIRYLLPIKSFPFMIFLIVGEVNESSYSMPTTLTYSEWHIDSNGDPDSTLIILRGL